MIREYTVLLDPPGLASKPSSLESTPAKPAAETQTSAAVTTAPERAVASPDMNPPGHTYTVAPRDTLDRIARMAGAHSRSERHKMMIAIFRANPGAFQTNINVLHRGATLHFPTEEQLSAISTEGADREYEAQIAAWRASVHRKSPTALASEAVAPIPILDAKPDTESPETDKSVLTERVASLEQSLHKLRRELEQPLVKRTMAAVAPGSAHSPGAITNQSYLEGARAPTTHSRIPFALLAVALGLVLATGAWFVRRRRNGDNPPTVPHEIQQSSVARTKEDQSVEAGEATPPLSQRGRGASLSGERAKSEVRQASSKASDSEPSWFKDSFSTPIDELLAGELLPDVEVAGDTVEQKLSFFTPDSNTNTTHVIVGSGLNEPPPFVERRKSPADVLRQAIEREPHRTDLWLKLLELYYTAAAENRRAFLEATRQLARNKTLAPEDWSRIEAMGRAIAPDDELFADNMDSKAVA
jgi:pilus assembly protein FimV